LYKNHLIRHLKTTFKIKVLAAFVNNLVLQIIPYLYLDNKNKVTHSSTQQKQ